MPKSDKDPTDLHDEELKRQTIDLALARVGLIARNKRKGGKSVVGQFIAERRAEAARE